MGCLRGEGGTVNVRHRNRALLTVLACGALAFAAGCGGDGDSAGAGAATTPAPAAAPAVPVRSGPLAPGDAITPAADTPARVARALRTGRPVVIAFLLGGVADDDAVRAALRDVSTSGPTRRGVEYVIYDVASQRDFGDLPGLLDVTGTPTVVVVARDRTIVNVWTGLVDAEMLRQSVVQAQESAPAA